MRIYFVFHYISWHLKERTFPKGFGLKVAKLRLKMPLKNKVKKAKLKGLENIWERFGQGIREEKGLKGKRSEEEK